MSPTPRRRVTIDRALGVDLGPKCYSFMKNKNRAQKSHATVPLKGLDLMKLKNVALAISMGKLIF